MSFNKVQNREEASINYSVYHKNFRKRRLECLANANFQCERCGVKHHSFAISTRSMELYVLYLHAAHVEQNDKLNPEADLVCLCPKHHWSFDHPVSIDDWLFIGKVMAKFLLLLKTEGEIDMDTQTFRKLQQSGLSDRQIKNLENLYNSELAQQSRNRRAKEFTQVQEMRLSFYQWLVQTGRLTD